MAKKLMMAILILLSICLFTSCSLGENSLYAFFADWQEEQDSCVAVFDESTGCVTFGEKTVDLYSVLDNYYENSKSGSVLAEYEGKIFGIHRYGFKNEQYYETIDVYALDIETQSIEILHTKDYCPRQVADDESVWRQTKFYYSNHYVVLCDGVVMTRVNIETGVVEEFLPDTFSYPNEKYTVEYVTDFDGKKDCEKVKIIGEDLEREVSLEYMAQKNALVNSLLELENEKTFFGKTEPLDNFFYGSSVIDDKIYFICRVLDEDGESNAVVFSYDISTDVFAFLYHGFSSDMPNIYLIPRE